MQVGCADYTDVVREAGSVVCCCDIVGADIVDLVVVLLGDDKLGLNGILNHQCCLFEEQIFVSFDGAALESSLFR